MPNWCENHLSVRGPEQDVTAFVERARGTGPKYKPRRSETQESDKEEMKVQELCFHALVPVPDRLLAKTYGGEEEARAQGREVDTLDSNACGYDWEAQNWGCKWGASLFEAGRPAPTEATYDFDTPWAPPIPFLEKASALFRSLEFRLEYREPNMDFKGWCVVQGGRVEQRVEGNCRVRQGCENFEHLMTELESSGEATIHREEEVMPELHPGRGLPSVCRLFVRRRESEGDFEIFSRVDDDFEAVAHANDSGGLRAIYEQMEADPLRWLGM